MSWREMPYADAVDRLLRAHHTFAEARTLRDGLARSSDVGDAVLAFLRHDFDRDPRDGGEDPPAEIWGLLPVLFKNLDDAHVDALLGDVLFQAPHPAVYGTLAHGVRWRVPAPVAEAALVAQLDSADPRRRSNAVELAYFLFGEDPHYRISDAGRRALAAASSSG